MAELADVSESIGNHADTYTEGSIERRSEEIQTQLNRMLLKARLPEGGPKRITQFGSGAGGETKGYNAYFPESQIVAVDGDERARVAAENNGAEFTLMDLKITSLLVPGPDRILHRPSLGFEITVSIFVNKSLLIQPMVPS